MRLDRGVRFLQCGEDSAVTVDKDWMAGNGVGEWWMMIYHGNIELGEGLL